MKFLNPYLTELQKVDLLQRWILVHSILYYELDTTLVSDAMFNHNAYQLVDMMKTLDQKTLHRSRFWYAMDDFDGSTGFDLPQKLTQEDVNTIRDTANYLNRVFGEKRKGK